MRLANFSVLIPEGEEKSTDHVHIQHGRQYGIRIGNHDHRRCDAEVSVDGEHINTFRLNPGQVISIKGPTSGDRGLFTAFAAESDEGHSAGSGGISRSNRGLITVRFKPEYRIHTRPVNPGTKSPWIKRNVMPLPDDDDRARWISNPADVKLEVMNSVRSCASPQLQSFGERSAVTGLTGQNDQSWSQAAQIDHDPSAEVVISLRLVACGVHEPERVRPVKQKCCGRCGCSRQANPVPAPVAD